MAYLALTRILAGFVVIIPLYALGITMTFLSAQVTTVFLYGQSHRYIPTLLPDILRLRRGLVVRGDYPLVAVVVMTTHCYYGYNASGGPVASVKRSAVDAAVVDHDRRRGRSDAMAVYGKNPELQTHGCSRHDDPGEGRTRHDPAL